MNKYKVFIVGPTAAVPHIIVAKSFSITIDGHLIFLDSKGSEKARFNCGYWGAIITEGELADPTA